MEKYISKLDTDRFGFKIAKVNDFDDKPNKIVELLEKEGVKLIMSRVPSADIELINLLEQIGFKLKDIQLTYNHYLKDIPEGKDNLKFILRDFKKEDIEQITDIAGKAFINYGHYSADDKLKDRTVDIYRDWAKNSCTNKNIADKIIVAELDKEVIGFLSLKIINSNGQQHAVGGMGAVSPLHQKLGVFRAINIEAMNWANKNKLCRVEHNVLATNFPVNASYNRLNFNIINSEVTLHHWINEKEKLSFL